MGKMDDSVKRMLYKEKDRSLW